MERGGVMEGNMPNPQPATPIAKILAIVISAIVVSVVLFVIFVPELIEREEVREAKYEIVDQDYEVDDNYVCVDWGFIFCSRYGYVRTVSGYVKVRAIEEPGDYTVRIEVTSGLELSGESKSSTDYIYENQVETYYYAFDSFEIDESDIDFDTYTMDVTISGPKTVEKKHLTIFESLLE